jgi:hypothetical protein
MPARHDRDTGERGVPPLPTAVLEVLSAVPGWSQLPAELAALTAPGRALEALYREGVPLERLHAGARQLVAAAQTCPEPWPAHTQRLAAAIEVLRQATDSPFPADHRLDPHRARRPPLHRSSARC